MKINKFATTKVKIDFVELSQFTRFQYFIVRTQHSMDEWKNEEEKRE